MFFLLELYFLISFLISVLSKLNWTAVSCFVAVGALIITTYENRRRFRLDNNSKVKLKQADDLNEAIVDFIGMCDSAMKVASRIIRIIGPKTKALTDADKAQIIRLKEERNQYILKIEYKMITFRLLKARIPEIGDIYDGIKELNNTVNGLGSKINKLETSTEKLNEKYLKEVDSISKEQVEKIVTKTTEVYNGLVNKANAGK